MARVQPTETELKLQLAPKHIGWFRRSPALSNAVCTDVDIDNVYFDTADRLLQRHRRLPAEAGRQRVRGGQAVHRPGDALLRRQAGQPAIQRG